MGKLDHQSGKMGSWLSTEKRMVISVELQFTINKGGNSGVLFRSSHERTRPSRA